MVLSEEPRKKEGGTPSAVNPSVRGKPTKGVLIQSEYQRKRTEREQKTTKRMGRGKEALRSGWDSKVKPERTDEAFFVKRKDSKREEHKEMDTAEEGEGRKPLPRPWEGMLGKKRKER